MSTSLTATNGFMAVLWLVAAIIMTAVIGPALVEGSEGDRRAEADRDAIIGPLLTTAILVMLAYIAAAVGTGFEQPWGEGLTMMLTPLTFPILPIFIWQLVVLLRGKPA